jgi:hypothetical protein
MAPEQQPHSPDTQYIFGYLLEMYTYLVLANSFIPYGVMERRHVPFDGFVDNLVLVLSKYDTFGIMFAGCHELFELIPAISRFAAQRLKEEEEAPHAASLTSSDVFYTNTNNRIRDWQQSQPREISADLLPKRRAMGEIYRHALFIYLETAALGTAALPAGADVLARMHKHVACIGEVLLEHDVPAPTPATTTLRPTAAAGPVLPQANERERSVQGLRNSQRANWNSIRTAELLELVWADGDPKSFGPYGMYLAMERHRINLCLS